VNTPASRELVASINGREVGALREQGNLWSFHYVQSWIDAAETYDLAPNLRRADVDIIDGATLRPVQWFFDNLLPEKDARETLSTEAQVMSSDAFGLLEYYGRESAGAITLTTRGATLPAAAYEPLDDAELHRRIANRPRRSLMADAPKKMSNAGAQDKLAVVVRGSELFQPVGDAVSTHLLKPDHIDREQYHDTVANEYFVMRLAASLGLDVPAVSMRFVPDPVYLIERFDRETLNGATQRTHAIDACQLLGIDREFKYRLAGVDMLVRCIDLCENRARARQSLLELALFNVLTGNSDAHLKNISFRVGPGGIHIAPFYDLLSTESYNTAPGNRGSWPNAELTTPLGVARTFAQVNRHEFREFAAKLGVTGTAFNRVTHQFTEKIERAADEIIAEFEAMTFPSPTVRAGQLRVLATIRKIVIREMAAKLRG
jgi:serine/threonine-protein kinase HipA